MFIEILFMLGELMNDSPCVRKRFLYHIVGLTSTLFFQLLTKSLDIPSNTSRYDRSFPKYFYTECVAFFTIFPDIAQKF